MIDPDNIIILENKLPEKINLRNIPVVDVMYYDIEDDKDYEKYIKDIEKDVRRSIEYRRMIKWLREEVGMDKCAYLKGVTNAEGFDIKIEIHHYPFSLRDIAEIVYKKRSYYNESIEVEMVAEEVMKLHYMTIIGLIPLSETIHELTHNMRIFIPVDIVFGRYWIFVEYYKPFCTSEQLEVLDRIEKYSMEKTSYLYNTTIIEENQVTYNITNPEFQLPNFNNISNMMIERLEDIKNNNYLLPTVNDKPMEKLNIDYMSPTYSKEDMRLNPRSPIYFE